ncbi:glycosyltransferase family 2 protein [Flavobacteriaceae bacterium MHTCC 0001]
MRIAIVILNWNGKVLLQQFLPSVITHSKSATIYVADNASTDDSVTFLKAEFPQVKIIQNQSNGGYAKGYNDALQHVDADIFCLLNNDVEVTENWLIPIENTFNHTDTIAIVQPKLLDFKQKNCFEYAGAAGGFIDKFGYPYCRGRIFDTLEQDTGQYNDVSPIFWASGACFFIRSSVFRALHGFDETFFAHMEEIDLCWRAHNLGHGIVYNGNSTVYHLGGATLKNTNPQKTFLNFRNSLYTLVKNAKGHIFFLVLLRLVLDGVAGLKFLITLKPSHCIAIIRAHFSFYGQLARLLKLRRTTRPKMKYYQKTSIVWAYFVNRKKHFKSL